MSTITTSVLPVSAQTYMKANWAGPFFGLNLPFGRESQAFIQNVTELAKMGFDSPQNAKLFIQHYQIGYDDGCAGRVVSGHHTTKE
jgi:hypothetical protein